MIPKDSIIIITFQCTDMMTRVTAEVHCQYLDEEENIAR